MVNGWHHLYLVAYSAVSHNRLHLSSGLVVPPKIVVVVVKVIDLYQTFVIVFIIFLYLSNLILLLDTQTPTFTAYSAAHTEHDV